MRYSIFAISLLLFACAASCKKSTISLSPLASLNVTNAVVGGKTVKLNSNIGDSATNYNYKVFGLNVGNNSVYIYPTDDSTHPYYSNMVQTNNGDVYSLFLAGNVATKVDTVLLRESIPTYTDSSYAVRFINLVFNSQPITITLSTSPSVAQFTGIIYKQASAFKTYTAKLSVATDTFQVRDAVTNSILASYPIVKPRFFSCTLAWKGMVGGTGTNTPSLLRVNNY
jgi:hypothetical protein